MKPVQVLIAINSAVIIFHLLVLLGFLPLHIVWGGKLGSESEMYAFELPALGVSLFFLWVLLMEADILRFQFSKKVRKFIFVCFLILLVLNTLGNALAPCVFEKAFAVLTALMVLLLIRVLKYRA